MKRRGSKMVRKCAQRIGDSVEGLSPARRALIDRSIAQANQVGKDFPLPKHPGIGERGFGTVQLALAAVVLALLVGAWFAYRAHIANLEEVAYNRGVTETKLAAEEDRVAREAEVANELDLWGKNAADAEAEAAKHKANWQEAKREARRSGKPLGSCADAGPAKQPPQQVGAGGGDLTGNGIRAPGVSAGRPGGVVLHWRFVGLHDGSFTGLDGKPLFGASAEYAGAPERADTASPYGLDELAEVDGENFSNYSTCLRAFDEAVGKVRAAEEAWGRSHQ